MKFCLLTWHGTMICRTGDSAQWGHAQLRDGSGTEGIFEVTDAPPPELGTESPAMMTSFRFHFPGFGDVTATRADSGRGFNIKAVDTYITAEPHSRELCYDRLRPQTWETFLPLPLDRLSILAQLQSQDWIEAGSRRRVRKDKISIEAEFWLKVGVRHIDLARFDMGGITRIPNGSDTQFLFPRDHNSIETLIADTRNPSAPEDRLLPHVGNHAYTRVDSPEQLFRKGHSLQELPIVEDRFLPHPLFITVSDRDFFYNSGWNNRLPQTCVSTARVGIRSAEDRCVVLSPRAEGTVLDEEGVYKSIGFLRSAGTTPKNMRVEQGQVFCREDTFDGVEEIAGTVCVPFNGNMLSYYHWLIDALLPLEAIHSISKKPFSLLMPSDIKSRYKIDYIQSLALCGFGQIPIIYSNSEIVRVERALWLECRDEYEDIPASVIRGFQDRVSAPFINRNGQKSRIFIDRTTMRGIANTEEVNTFLLERGFTSYRLEELPLEAQISLFANAEFVIAPHGAGLTNLVFAPKGTKVLELMPNVQNRPFFWYLSATLGHIYGQMTCPTQPREFNGWLQVDLKRLTSLYDLLENA